MLFGHKESCCCLWVWFQFLECLATRSFPPGVQGDRRKEKQGGISSFEFRAKTGDVQIPHLVLVTLTWYIVGGKGLAASDRHSLNDLHICVQN